MEEIICTHCGEPLDEDELEHPYELDNEIVCDSCYRDKCFNCAICDTYTPYTEWNYFLLFKDDDDRLEPGVYKIIDNIFYTSNIIGSDTIFPGSVERVAGLPTTIEEDSNREICDECAKKLMEFW